MGKYDIFKTAIYYLSAGETDPDGLWYSIYESSDC